MTPHESPRKLAGGGLRPTPFEVIQKNEKRNREESMMVMRLNIGRLFRREEREVVFK